jgi:hypothetical protein
MERMVNRAPIDRWVKEAYPNGLYKLAQATNIPVNSLTKIRLGWVPKNEVKRQDLAKVLGVEESQIFPPLPGRGDRAS